MCVFQDAFSHLALFFYDEHGGDSIGVVWKPQPFKMQEVKVSSSTLDHRLQGTQGVRLPVGPLRGAVSLWAWMI